MARNKIYDQHDAAFKNVSAFVIMAEKPTGIVTMNEYTQEEIAETQLERVATVAFKFPAGGAGRLSCYLHVLSLPMVKGIAGGYGYDKKSAAFADAAKKQCAVKLESWQSADGYTSEYARAKLMLDCLTDGGSWDDDLRKAGFTVLQAV